MIADMLFQRCDFHVHSHLSPCACSEMRIPAIVEVCARRGIEHLGVTDHIFSFTDPAILDRVSEEAAGVCAPVKVFVGCEADILSVGKHTVTEEMTRKLDFISVAANHFHMEDVSRPDSDAPEAVGRHFLAMFRCACSLDFVDIIVHPMYVMPGTYDPRCLDLLGDDEMIDAIELAKTNGIAMEISPRALEPSQIDFRLRFYGLCKNAGLKFSFGSDAHSLSNTGQTQILAPLVRELAIGDDDVWLPG